MLDLCFIPIPKLYLVLVREGVDAELQHHPPPKPHLTLLGEWLGAELGPHTLSKASSCPGEGRVGCWPAPNLPCKASSCPGVAVGPMVFSSSKTQLCLGSWKGWLLELY